MKLTLESLPTQLGERLLPAYLVSGSEPLLVGEATDLIRQRARLEGYEGREVFFIERSAGIWDAVQQSAQSLSLFSARRVLDIRLPTGKPGVAGAAALQRIIQAAGADFMVLIVTEQLEREAAGAVWVQAVLERGAWLPLWSVERARLPQWLRHRLRDAGLGASDEAIALLAERSEGNLLAARQEIDKLALLLPAGATVSAADVAASSADSARFDVFQLGTAVRAGDAARALRILSGLNAEGAEPVLALWALVRELRARQGADQQVAPAAARAARSPARGQWGRLSARAARADRMAKGLLAGEAWDELALLAAEMCGLRPLPWPRGG